MTLSLTKIAEFITVEVTKIKLSFSSGPVRSRMLCTPTKGSALKTYDWTQILASSTHIDFWATRMQIAQTFRSYVVGTE